MVILLCFNLVFCDTISSEFLTFFLLSLGGRTVASPVIARGYQKSSYGRLKGVYFLPCILQRAFYKPFFCFLWRYMLTVLNP
jgi:hypothetical protein